MSGGDRDDVGGRVSVTAAVLVFGAWNRSGCSALSIIKQEDLMVVANIGDSRVVLCTAFDDDDITSST
uniref:protein-serine/threonine phosphatase n=1 Tax=Zea mays TaxID=4577 RepID=A0A804P1G1_MAIZE